MKSSNSPRSRTKKNSCRNFFADTYIEEFNEDEGEQEEDDAFIVHNLSSFDLKRHLKSPRSIGEEKCFWNFYKNANITLYASQTYNNKGEKEEEDDNEVENKNE